nr:ATP synthase F0 subunit 8 [Nionia sp.]
MPQMSPMWWMTLMFVFLCSYLIMMTKIYWMKSSSLKSSHSTMKYFMNWKW